MMCIMKNKTLGFIGGGRIANIFLQAFSNKKMAFDAVYVYDINHEVVVALKKGFPFVQAVHTAKEAASRDIVFIALHPPAIMDTLDMIKDVVTPNTLIISLAPKISMEKMHQKLGVRNIIRLIPNATSYINEGFNPVSFSKEMDTELKSEVMSMLKTLGNTFEVEEYKLESYAIISAMLPTYFWFQWEELKNIGASMGLDEKESNEAIYETMVASLNLMFKSGMSFEQVADLIPVKPIGEHESLIKDCFKNKLLPLFEKIKP